MSQRLIAIMYPHSQSLVHFGAHAQRAGTFVPRDQVHVVVRSKVIPKMLLDPAAHGKGGPVGVQGPGQGVSVDAMNLCPRAI